MSKLDAFWKEIAQASRFPRLKLQSREISKSSHPINSKQQNLHPQTRKTKARWWKQAQNLNIRWPIALILIADLTELSGNKERRL